jgi:DNA-binding MarR family transcriptional regulator
MIHIPSQKKAIHLLERFMLYLQPAEDAQVPLSDLTMSQLRAMFVLYHADALRMSELASKLGIGLSAVSSLVAKLEGKRYVTREHCTTDRRGVNCALTSTGQRELERLWNYRRDVLSHAIRNIPEEKLETVTAALETLTWAAKEWSQAKGVLRSHKVTASHPGGQG